MFIFTCPKRFPSSPLSLPSYNGSLCLTLKRSIFFERIPLMLALSFSPPLQCRTHQHILMTFSELVLGSIPHHSKHCQIAKSISTVFPVCGRLGTRKNLLPFSLQIEGRGSERSSIQDFQKTDSVISTSLLLLISKIQKLWQHL